MSIHGIDVSRFQGDIDWRAVRDSGIQFAMLRAGYGENNIDERFRRNAEGCRDVGLPFGVYWFSYALNEEMARREAEYCVEAIRDYEVQYPICFDFEYASIDYAREQGVEVDRELATRLVEAFCERGEQLGYFSMYYSNLDLLDRLFDDSLRRKYALWYAQYAAAPAISGMAMWQYRDNGRVAGISGNVDFDIAYYDLAEVISRAGLNRLTRRVTTPRSATPEPNDVLIYIVRPGDTLSEIAAKYGLTYQELAEYNRITNPNLIYPGQRIRIPLGR